MGTKDFFYLSVLAILLYLVWDSNQRIATLAKTINSLNPGDQVASASQEITF